jgi:trk system potassium uptake protein TrkH
MAQDHSPPVPARVRQSGEALTGRHVGDRRMRIARRPETQQIPVPEMAQRPRPAGNPAVFFLYSFVALIAIGTVLLMLPFAGTAGEWTSPLTALFTATSAVCVTGLVVVDTGTYWSGFGQAVILLLFQVGGLGFMTSSTALFLLMGRRITLRDRVLLKESLAMGGLGTVYQLARRILLFTLVAEVAGAVLLTARFLAEVDPLLALWWGVFHSASAFNNAGFDLFGNFRGLTAYSQDLTVLAPIIVLFVLGSSSYPVVLDLLTHRRRFARLSLDTKLVVTTTAAMLVLGTAALLVIEHANPRTLGAMDLGTRVLNAFFLAASRTAGFSTVDLGSMSEGGLLVLIGLMFVGGAAGSTAGGIKVQTFAVLFFAILSAVRGDDEVRAFRRTLPLMLVMRALAVALLSIAWVFAVALALNLAEDSHVFGHVLFEAFSAFGTVGYTAGVTPSFSPAGQMILVVAMFAGRLGPLSLVLAIAAREHQVRYRWAQESARIG